MTETLDDAATDPGRTIAELQRKLAERTAELTDSLERQNATAEILRMIASAPGDAGRSLQLIAETSARLFGAPSVSIQLVKDGEWADAYRLGNSAKSIRVAVPLNQIRVGGRNLPGTVVGQNRQIHIPDLDHLDPSLADFPGLPVARAAGTRTMCGTPLRREGEPIGALIVYRDRLLPFTNEELALQQTFADQAVIAIENTRLFNEVEAKSRDLGEALEQQTATSEVLAVISRSPSDLTPVLEAISDTAARLCGSEQTMFFRYDGAAFRILASWNFPPEVHEMLERRPLMPGHPSAIGRAGASLRPVCIPDVLADPAYGLTGEQSRARYRATLAVPLLREGRLIGALSLNRSEPGAFTEKQIELVTTFADQAVIAIENVRLFDEVQARTNDLQESLEYQTATSDVLKVISRSSFDLQPVLDTLVDTAVKLCGALNGTICLREGDGYRYRASSGIHGDWAKFLDEHPPTPGRSSMTGRVLLSGRPESVPDVLQDPDYVVPLAAMNKTRSVFGVPLLRHDRVEGVLLLARAEPGLFTQRQIELVQTFADQAVIAIENARLLTELRQRTDDLTESLERLRTAQDRLVQTEKLASLGQLTAGIAHEIKNPLNFVNNFSALSAELTDELNDALKPVAMDVKVREEVTELTGMLKDNLEKVVQHGKRADSIVKNMLLHSREGSGEQRPANINALLDESLNLAYHGARAEKPEFNITLRRDLDPDAGVIDVFPQEITRAFINLISNGFYAANKHKAENGDPDFEPVLGVATKNLGSHVEIRIRDNGTGIPAEVKEKIFNPFFTTKPAGEGTGLGLSMSHDIVVKQHGGRIEVDTQPGQFTEFTIVLPRQAIIQK